MDSADPCWYLFTIRTDILTFGYKLLPAGRAATTSYIQVPFSAIAGMVIFYEKISYNFIIGSMVIFYTIYLIVKERSEVI